MKKRNCPAVTRKIKASKKQWQRPSALLDYAVGCGSIYCIYSPFVEARRGSGRRARRGVWSPESQSWPDASSQAAIFLFWVSVS